MKQWKTQWDGHPIRVERDDAWSKGETRIFVDGVRVHRAEDKICHEPDICGSEFEDENGTHRIKVKISSALMREFCHIFIDDELIGGDTDKKLILFAAPEKTLAVPAQKKQLRRELFFRAVVAPLILIPLCDMMDMYFLNNSFSILIAACSIMLVNVAETLFKVCKISLQTPTDKPKNSTPV